MNNKETTTKYVAYFRVSTKMQGLGIDAQRTTVHTYCKNSGTIIAEFEEKESGKNDNRPELAKALDVCRTTGATLLIAKLDRLSRNVKFLFTLKESGIQIKACDCPELDSLTLAIFAGLAQRERELISTRTKAALAELKAQGVKLGADGDRFGDEGRKASIRTRQDKARTNADNVRAWGLVQMSVLTMGQSLSFATAQLNQFGFKTAKGGTWTATKVDLLIQTFTGKTYRDIKTERKTA